MIFLYLAKRQQNLFLEGLWEDFLEGSCFRYHIFLLDGKAFHTQNCISYKKKKKIKKKNLL